MLWQFSLDTQLSIFLLHILIARRTIDCHICILPAYENGTGLFTCHRSASGARSNQVTSRPFR
jgi:hypothetical protein